MAVHMSPCFESPGPLCQCWIELLQATCPLYWLIICSWYNSNISAWHEGPSRNITHPYTAVDTLNNWLFPACKKLLYISVSIPICSPNFFLPLFGPLVPFQIYLSDHLSCAGFPDPLLRPRVIFPAMTSILPFHYGSICHIMTAYSFPCFSVFGDPKFSDGKVLKLYVPKPNIMTGMWNCLGMCYMNETIDLKSVICIVFSPSPNFNHMMMWVNYMEVFKGWTFQVHPIAGRFLYRLNCFVFFCIHHVMPQLLQHFFPRFSF